MTNFTSTLLKTGTTSTTQIQPPHPLANSPEISLKRLDPTYPVLSTSSNTLNNNSIQSSSAYSPNTLLLNNRNNSSCSSSSVSSLSDSSSNILYKTTAALLPSPEENGANSIEIEHDGGAKILTGSKPLIHSSDNLINYNNKFIPSSELMKFVENESMNRKLNQSVTDFDVTVKQRLRYLVIWCIHQVKTSTYQSWIKFSVFIMIVIGICLAIFVFKVQNHLDVLQEFVKKFGVAIGGIVFMGVFILLIVFLIPVTIPTILAGIIFKPWFGVLFVWGASVIGGTISFILGRYVFRKSIAKKIEKNKKLLAVDQAIGQEGWKIVLLLRLTPIIPESLLNYALSVTRIKFHHYIVCSGIGLIPGVSFFIYLGTVIGSISEIKKVHIKKGEIALYIISGVLMVFTLLFLGIIVKRAVNKKLEQEESKGLLDEEEKINADTNSDAGSNIKSPSLNFNFDEIEIENENNSKVDNDNLSNSLSTPIPQNNNIKSEIEYSIN